MKTLEVGQARQLFIDDLFMDSSRNVRLQMHPAQKTGEESLVADKPWERVTLNWMNVMEDGGKYRMWYEAYDVDDGSTPDDSSFCYAESVDGRCWTKPEVGQWDYQGSRRNNILFRMIGGEGYCSRIHGTGVFKDPAASPGERYKAVSQGQFPGENGFETSWAGIQYHKIAGMYSPDGLRWTRYPRSISNEFADSQHSGFWDERLGKYVIYGRYCPLGRVIGRSESTDFHAFPPLKPVLQADVKDPAGSNLYNPAAMKYPHADDVYLMFPSLFRPESDTLDIRLAVSRDGVRWTYPEQDKAFIELGKPGQFDCGSLYMGHGLLRIGRELWQYYSGSSQTHEGRELNTGQPSRKRVFSRVGSRVDGYVSVEAGSMPGEIITPPLTFRGNGLALNVNIRPGGEVRVAFLGEDSQPIAGRNLVDCIPLTGDHTNIRVRWLDGADVARRAGMPTRLQFRIRNAGLYAFQFGEGDPCDAT